MVRIIKTFTLAKSELAILIMLCPFYLNEVYFMLKKDKYSDYLDNHLYKECFDEGIFLFPI